MESYKNKDLINLTEFGQYLRSAFEFCILQEQLKCVSQIKWNIQYLDFGIIYGRGGGREFFLEIVIVIPDLTLNIDYSNSIFQSLNKFFTIEREQLSSREIDGNFFIISTMHDTLKEKFILKSGGEFIPDRFKKYEVTISIESSLRDLSSNAKLILSSDDVQREEKKLIEELITERSNIEEKLKSFQKPIVVCEGKTDIKIIETAWRKLYSGKEIPFEIVPSGVWLEVDKSKGNANQVRRLLEQYSKINPDGKVCVGLFDNDGEGNCQFKGLSIEIFEESTPITKKHKKKKVYGMLLPVPTFRKAYVGKSMRHKYFMIEHYFSDKILQKYNMIGETITPDSVLFSISGNKNTFSNSIADLDKSEFESMKILFEELNKIICSK